MINLVGGLTIYTPRQFIKNEVPGTTPRAKLTL